MVQLVADYAKEPDTPPPFGRRYDLCDLPLHKKYRSTYEIVALVLEAVKSEAATSFPIMRYASLNCTQLKKYLRSLTDIGLVEAETENGNASYKATKRGLDFLSQYYVLLGILLSAPPKEKHMPSQNKRTVLPILQRKI